MIPFNLLGIFSSLKKAASIALDIFNAIPGWMWAAALLFVWLNGCTTREALQDLRETHSDLVTQVEAQKSQAAALLQAAHAQVTALQDQLTASAKRKDAQDVHTLHQLHALGSQLRSLRTAGRLRDPNASWPSGASACTQPAQGSAPGDADRAETTGLLSEPLTELLLTDSAEADRINAAYTRCRADFRELTQLYEAWRAGLNPTPLPTPAPPK